VKGFAYTFNGGIHVEEYKRTRRSRIETLPPPKTVSIPLSQHIGKPAVPVAAVGDEVKRGDLIAEAAEGLSANIHTGFEGVVKEITPQGIRIGRREA